MTKKTPARILFVCLGNICRSPTAEAIFRAYVKDHHLKDVTCDSAGTSDWHIGATPDPRTIAAGHQRGYALESLYARQVSRDDFYRFTHIVAMDRNNMAHLNQMAPPDHGAKLYLMLDFAATSLKDVPDPYSGGPDGFIHVIDLLEQACDGLINTIKT